MQKITTFLSQNKLVASSILGGFILFVVVCGLILTRPSEIALKNSFKDKFSSEDLTKYTRIGGTWKVTNGVAIVSEPILAPAQSVGITNINLYKNSNSGFNEWKLKVEAKINSSKAVPADAAIVFNYKNANNYYYVDYTTSGGSIRKIVSGVETKLASFSNSMKMNDKTKLEVRRKGSEYKVYLDSSLVTRVEDKSITDGLIGMGSKNSVVEFDNFDFNVKGQPVTSTPVTPTPTDPTPTDPTPTNPTPTPTDPSAIQVKTGDELIAQLRVAKPGTTIELMANTTYQVAKSTSFNGNAARFVATGNGTSEDPITIEGPSSAVIDGGGTTGNYALYLANASYWVVKGVSVANASKGIVMDKSHHITIDGVHVYNIGEEGVHFRDFTTDSTIQNSLIEKTGQNPKKIAFGEGVYIGSAESNWKKDSKGNKIPVNSDRNYVFNNTIQNTSAENIDIKEGSSLGVIKGNTLDGVNMRGDYANSTIDVKGNDYIIVDNTVTLSGASNMIEGFQVHQVVNGWGQGNNFSNNKFSANVKLSGWAINVQTKKNTNNYNNVVYDNNIQMNYLKGLTNIEVAS
jgi:hypothetical protein